MDVTLHRPQDAHTRSRSSHSGPAAVWFQDEARVGRQGTLTRVWAERGSCLRAVRQTEYQWGYIFGAANPLTGQSSALSYKR